MKKNVCYFIACLIVPGIWLWGAPSAAAQGHCLKNAANQAAHKAKGVLSPAQKAVKQSQLEALQQVRRELARTPGILFTQDFKPQLEILKQMEVYSAQPAKPQELFAALNQKIDLLIQESGLNVFPISLHKTPNLAPQPKALSRWEAFEKAVKTRTPRFEWKTAYGQTVYMGPAAFPKKETHRLYPCREAAIQITRLQYHSLSQIFERIFSSRLTGEQKLALARHLSQTAEAAGTDLTLRYINFFRQIPAVKMQGWLPPANGEALEIYARHKISRLVEKLKQEQKLSEREINLLLDLTALLPVQESRRLLASLSYLEPIASQWLMLASPQSALNKSIETQLQTAKERGIRSPKQPLKETLPQNIALKRAAFLYRQSASYTELLSHIKSRVQSIEYALKQTSKASLEQLNTPQALAQRLYVEAYKTRLKNLQNKVWNRLEEIETELNSLETFITY